MSDIFGGVASMATTYVFAASTAGQYPPWIDLIVAAASALIYAGINLLVKFLTAKLTKSGKISKEDADKINSTADDLADDGKINGSNVDK